MKTFFLLLALILVGCGGGGDDGSGVVSPPVIDKPITDMSGKWSCAPYMIEFIGNRTLIGRQGTVNSGSVAYTILEISATKTVLDFPEATLTWKRVDLNTWNVDSQSKTSLGFRWDRMSGVYVMTN
jgi:hypothetical protein